MVDVLAVGEVKLVPQERVQLWFDGMEVVRCEKPQGRISQRMGRQSTFIEAPEISCRESVERVRNVSEERSSERMCEQSEVINNLKLRADLAAYSGAESR